MTRFTPAVIIGLLAGALSIAGVAPTAAGARGLSPASVAELSPAGFGETLTSETVAGGYVFAAAPTTTGPAGVREGAVFVFAPTEPGSGSALSEVAELTPDPGSGVDDFGQTLTVSPDGQEVFVAAGTVKPATILGFSMPPGGWAGPLTPGATLVAAGGDSALGTSLSLDGDTLVAGDPDASAAFVFERPAAGWVGSIDDSARLSSTDPTAVDGFGTDFGWGVDVAGGTIVVGDGARISSGGPPTAAYVFQRPDSGWRNMTESARLTASGGTLVVPQAVAESSFSMSPSGGEVAIPAMVRNGGAFRRGEVLMFTRPSSGWAGTLTQSATLTAPDLGFLDAPIIAGDAVYASGGGEQVFSMPAAGWTGSVTSSATLTAADGAPLPSPVSVSGDEVLAGGSLDGPLAAASQTSLLFTEPLGGWSGEAHETATLTVPPPTGPGPTPAAFVEPASGWASESSGALLTPPGSTASLTFSTVSASASTVVATPGETGFETQGPAYVFVRGAAGWRDAVETTTLSDSSGAILGPAAVSGSTIVMPAGAHVDVFTEPAGGWVDAVHETATLSGPDAGVLAGAAISADTVVSGRDVFVEPSAGWATATAPTARLLAPAVAPLSCDDAISGATIALDCGDWIRIYRRPEMGWAGTVRPVAVLVPPHARHFARSVAVSGRDVAVLTGTAGNPGGVAAIFAEPPSGWRGRRPPSALVSGIDVLEGFRLSSQLALDHGLLAISTVSGDHYGDVGSAVTIIPPPARGWGRGPAPQPLFAGDISGAVALSDDHIFTADAAVDVSTLTGQDPPTVPPGVITGAPGHERLSFTIARGFHAPDIRAVAIGPPGGFRLARRSRHSAVNGVQQTLVTGPHSRLVIRLRHPSKQITVDAGLVGGTRSRAGRPSAQLTITDAAGRRTTLRVPVRLDAR